MFIMKKLSPLWQQIYQAVNMLKNVLRIDEENTKENHNSVVSLYEMKIRVTLS